MPFLDQHPGPVTAELWSREFFAFVRDSAEVPQTGGALTVSYHAQRQAVGAGTAIVVVTTNAEIDTTNFPGIWRIKLPDSVPITNHGELMQCGLPEQRPVQEVGNLRTGGG